VKHRDRGHALRSLGVGWIIGGINAWTCGRRSSGGMWPSA
jgi:hypothetical protein